MSNRLSTAGADSEIAIPEPLRSAEATMDDGAVIRIRQHGNPDGPRLALSHGNGLAIDGYCPFWELLRERYELILFDFRNHGQNPLHTFEHHGWPHFVADLERVYHFVGEIFGRKRITGVFHSLSAVSASMHTQKMGARWDPLVLFDPPFYPRDGHPLRALQAGNEDDIAARAARRTSSYKDPRELANQFERRLPGWRPGAYELMARATLRLDPVSREWVLVCPREFEAHVFRSNRDTSTWTGLGRMPVSVKLICADPASAAPPALIGKALAAESDVDYEAIPGTSHFLQIERPEECLRAMETFLRRHGVIA
jgi:pimeloyl-ACP methyl ester carboxylesterase